ncbi:MAG TPA: hypothetical protein VHD33_00680, partial [Legionellaceae bacterium]|nr:hypothetical protein [Legionellaceae bacterium]
RREFINMQASRQLRYLLKLTSGKGHTRPNFSKNTYYKTYLAYVKFREFYKKLPAGERSNLDKVSIRYSINTCTFAEIWNHGNPGCMAWATKLFSILPLKYVPTLKYKCNIELAEPADKVSYLKTARESSPALSDKIIMDIPGIYNIDDLSYHLTHESMRDNFLGMLTRGFCKLGLYIEDDASIEIPQELLVADASVQESTSRSEQWSQSSSGRSFSSSSNSIFQIPRAQENLGQDQADEKKDDTAVVRDAGLTNIEKKTS